MKLARGWVLAVLALAILMPFMPSAGAEESQSRSVEFYTAYERAEQAGMYVSVTVNADTEGRMRTRLSGLVAASQDRFDDPKTAENVITSWFQSTHYNIADLFTVSEGSGAGLRISPDYLRVFDFLAISDAQGRIMLYPFQQYPVNLYDDLLNAAVPQIHSAIYPLLANAFAAVADALEDEAIKTALQTAFDAAYPTFTITVADARKVLSEDTVIREGVTLKSATNVISDLTVGNLGALKPVMVATENTDEAWYKLSLSETSLTGFKLPAPVPISEIRNTTTATATAWLNEQGELIYITASASWLSADASELAALLAARGGTGTAAAPEKTPAPETQEKSSNTVWYVVAVLAAAAVIAGAWLLLRGKGNRRNYGKSGSAALPKEEPKEEPKE